MAVGWRGQYLRYREFFLNIMELYQRRADLRAFLEIVLSLTTITIFSVFALRPTAITIISLLNEIKGKQETVSGLEQKVRNLATAQNVYAQNQAFIPDIDAAISTLPTPDVLVRQVEGIAAKNSVKVLGMSIGEVVLIGEPSAQKRAATTVEPLPAGAQEMPISISVSGTYQTLDAFIKDFENLRIPNKIDVLGINTTATDTGNVIVAVISGRTPFIGP